MGKTQKSPRIRTGTGLGHLLRIFDASMNLAYLRIAEDVWSRKPRGWRRVYHNGAGLRNSAFMKGNLLVPGATA